MSGGNDLAQLKVRATREGSASNLLHLALAMAMETFRYFSSLFGDPFPSGITGMFFARKMHSTSEFAKIVLSKCVCVCMIVRAFQLRQICGRVAHFLFCHAEASLSHSLPGGIWLVGT